MIYTFRITFEDYDDVSRDIEIKSIQTFEDLHYAIHNAIGFKPDAPSSFYISNDYWHKGKEIAFSPTDEQKEKGAVAMNKSRLCDFIEDPHQKIYYIFDHNKPWTFYIELLRISDNKPNAEYPVCVKSLGNAPKQFVQVIPPSAEHDDADEGHDFLHETEYVLEGEEEMEELGLDAEEGEEKESSEEESLPDEISDEFSNNEGIEEDNEER